MNKPVRELLTRNSTCKVQSEPPRVSLRFEGSIITPRDHDPTQYCTCISGKVIVGYDGPSVGTFRIYLCHIALARANRVWFAEVLDAVDYGTSECLELFDFSTGEFHEDIIDKYSVYTPDFIVLDRIQIKPKFRGKGYGLVTAYGLIETFAAAESLVVCKPAPIRDDDSEFADGEFEAGQARLAKHWSLCGFRPYKKTELFVLSTAMKRPSLEQAFQKYRAEKQR